jgi:uncharacterized glyoxalase superfamily metalloenzyme YdcJ
MPACWPQSRRAEGEPGCLLVASGHVSAEPIIYEDFLPVSAAGIFSSNLGDEGQQDHRQHAAKAAFERDLGVKVGDDDALYAAAERQSVEATWPPWVLLGAL